MGYIYKIINDINDKVYIGKTVRTIQDRWQQHIRNAFDKNKPDTHFHRAIKKYGVEHFTPVQIGEYPNNELNKMEIYWIGKYNSFEEGYNSTLGGDGGETFNYDKMFSAVCQIDLYEDKVLRTYQSISEACKELGNKNYSANISACCRGIQKQAYGYRWSYADNIVFNSIQNERWQQVYQIDPYTIEIINIFPSVAEAAYYIDGIREGNTSTNIATACRNIHKWVDKPYGYAWAYDNTLKDIKQKLLDTNRIVLQCDLQDGHIIRIFSSKRKAQQHETNNVHGQMTTKLKNIGDEYIYHNFLWKLVNKV